MKIAYLNRFQDEPKMHCKNILAKAGHIVSFSYHMTSVVLTIKQVESYFHKFVGKKLTKKDVFIWFGPVTILNNSEPVNISKKSNGLQKRRHL